MMFQISAGRPRRSEVDVVAMVFGVVDTHGSLAVPEMGVVALVEVESVQGVQNGATRMSDKKE